MSGATVRAACVGVALIIVATVAYAVGRSGRTAPEAPRSPVAHAAAPQAPDMRPAIAAAIANEASSVHDGASLDAYLASLRARAMQARRVGALEVEPGLAAIDRLEPVLGPQAAQAHREAFTQAMGTLSQQFRNETEDGR